MSRRQRVAQAVVSDPRYEVLFEPVAIGPKTLPNRFFQTAHCNSAGSDRPGFQSYFRAMKAQGGWGAVSTEYCSIAPESDDLPRVSARLWDDGDVENLAQVCELLHEQGTLAAVELFHGGPNTGGLESRLPARGASQMPSTFEFSRSCRDMDVDDIREVQAQYVSAALRAREAGFDIVTIYASHSTGLPQQFLVPFYNRRTDEYGGSFENRARFCREVTDRVRGAVGDECAISIRIGLHTVPSHGELGIAFDGDGQRFIEHMDDLVDLWDVIGDDGNNVAPSRFAPENFERPYLAGIKQHTDKPVINVGRFTNPDTMVEVITSGQADIIGAARPSIADPFLPQKIRDGRLDDIRECIGCNICISRWKLGGAPLVCTQNPTAGEEYRRGWHPEHFERAANADKDVLVIGAGPAGLECAMVLGKREMHAVHLVDAGAEPGGRMNLIRQLPGLAEWARHTSYRTNQLSKLRNVTVISGVELDRTAVLEYGAEIVIVATGSSWAGDGLNGFTHNTIPGVGAEAPHCLTPEQVMAGKATGGTVLVYDTDGYFMGAGMAQLLAGRGARVIYATPFETIAPYTVYTLEHVGLNRELRRAGIELLTGHVMASIAPGTVSLTSRWDDTVTHELVVDSTVLVTQRRSDDRLYRELKGDAEALARAGVEAVYAIGDCVAPQLIADATFSGHRLAREIDCPDPSVPLPFIRERQLWSSAAKPPVPGTSSPVAFGILG